MHLEGGFVGYMSVLNREETEPKNRRQSSDKTVSSAKKSRETSSGIIVISV